MKLTIELTENDDQTLVDNVLNALRGTSQQNPVVKPVEETPAAEPVEETPAVNYEDLDVDGLPWDHRIHSSSKAKLKDGTWRQRRGVDPDVYEKVVTELRATMAAGTAVDTPAEPTTQTDPVAQTAPPPPAAETETKTAPPPPPAAETEEPTFQTLMFKVSKLKVDGVINDEQFKSIYNHFELPTFAAFAQRPDLIPQAMEIVKAYE